MYELVVLLERHPPSNPEKPNSKRNQVRVREIRETTKEEEMEEGIRKEK